MSDTVRPVGSYTFQAARGTGRVAERHGTEAAQIDTDRDGHCSDTELETYMRDQGIIKPEPARSNVPRLLEEYKAHLAGKPLRTAREDGKDYHSLEQIEHLMHHIVEHHPDRAQMVTIGKSAEGRDIIALKVTSGADGDTSNKPGVVFTGAHHAREWMTPEVTIGMAHELVDAYDSDPEAKRRMDNAEMWFIPVVNPDGFKYSQTEDSMWRKNRGVIPGSDEIGVDLNRNYWDGKPEHLGMYRAEGDSPNSTWDDYGASDSPRSEAYRGPAPASEPEVQALMAFEYGRPNIHGIVDHHSYGGMIMHPWDHIPDPPPEAADYAEIGKRMLAAQGEQPYDYIQTYELYPTTGASVGCHEVNGRYGIGIEMGESFQPPYSEFDSIYNKVAPADMAFVDWITEKFPVQTPPTDPPAPPTEPTDPPAPPTDPPAPPTEPPPSR